MESNIKLYIIGLLLLFILIILIFSKTYSNYKNYKKKIALCFLIYDTLNHEDLWHKWLKNVDKNKYTIYIHYKENKPLKHFEKYKLKDTIETCWGCLSIVQAQNLILKEALNDHKNEHIIWLSQSCIPIKTFDYVYDFLINDKSYFNVSPDKQVFPRGNNLLKYIKKDKIKKSAMPSIICKKHATIFINNEDKINNWFKNIPIPDELCYITLLHHFNEENNLILTPNLSADAIIYTGWPDMKNYRKFDLSKLSNNQPNNYDEICPDELDYLIKSKSLFARKFNKNCKGLENLIEKVTNNK